MLSSFSPKGIVWTLLSEPTPAELARIIRELHLEEADARLCTEKHVRPAWFTLHKYLFLSITVPVFLKKNRVTIGATLLFFVTADRLISVHHEPIPLLKRIYDNLTDNPDKYLHEGDTRPVDLLFRILFLLNEGTHHKVERLAKYTAIVEDAVFQGNERKMVEEISLLTRDVMDIRKIFQPHRQLFNLFPPHALLTADTYDTWLQLKQNFSDSGEALDILYESIKQLGLTNSTLLQHKENELLRMLTFYSILGIPAWMLIGPFNPSKANASAYDFIIYWAVVGALVVILLFIFFRFRGKRVL